MPSHTVKQKESVNDVVINLDLSSEQQDEVGSLLREYKEIFSDVPKVTNLIEHKVELTRREPIDRVTYLWLQYDRHFVGQYRRTVRS